MTQNDPYKFTKEQEFYDRYPYLFSRKELSKKETCMSWGINITDKYEDLLENVCNLLVRYNANKDEDHKIVFEQIKEKFKKPVMYFHVNKHYEDNTNEYNLYISLIDKVDDLCHQAWGENEKRK